MLQKVDILAGFKLTKKHFIKFHKFHKKAGRTKFNEMVKFLKHNPDTNIVLCKKPTVFIGILKIIALSMI